MRMEEFLPPFMVGWAINSGKFKLEHPLNERHAQLDFDLSAIADETKRTIIMPDSDVDLSSLAGNADHAQLDNLLWTASAHTGTADHIPAFDSQGDAITIPVPTGETDHTQLTSLPWIGSGHTGQVDFLAGFASAGAAGDVTVGDGLNLTAGVLTATGVGATAFDTAHAVQTAANGQALSGGTSLIFGTGVVNTTDADILGNGDIQLKITGFYVITVTIQLDPAGNATQVFSGSFTGGGVGDDGGDTTVYGNATGNLVPLVIRGIVEAVGSTLVQAAVQVGVGGASTAGGSITVHRIS